MVLPIYVQHVSATLRVLSVSVCLSASLPHTNEPTIVLFVVNNCIPRSIHSSSATELIYIFGAEFQNMYLTERWRVCEGVEGKRAHI